MTHTDCQSVWSYRSPIRMTHTDHQSICTSHTSSSPTMKIDQNPPYTPHQCTYTTGEQIHFQTALNGKWCCINEKILLLFITENTIRVFSTFRKFVGCPSKNVGCPKQFPNISVQFWSN